MTEEFKDENACKPCLIRMWATPRGVDCSFSTGCQMSSLMLSVIHLPGDLWEAGLPVMK